MKELIVYIARSLVDHPDAVQVTEVMNGQDLVLELRVAKDDLGKIIGRQGRMARGLRTVLFAAAARSGQRVLLDIVE
ncbi:MAG: KH domain-containing protein [Deltaproteobacteria bacterium]|jgi:predicted RNA-binding protein YlqC (UPF0109 family)|nr:KH domain-containing protein [Deltaproteobacteria bacterium]